MCADLPADFFNEIDQKPSCDDGHGMSALSRMTKSKSIEIRKRTTGSAKGEKWLLAPLWGLATILVVRFAVEKCPFGAENRDLRFRINTRPGI